MAVRRKILTLTLIGLMAAFIFPLCANALEIGEEAPTNLAVAQDDEYDAMPTFTWTAVSGATSFDIKFGTTTLNYSAGTLITDPADATKKKWATYTGTLVNGEYNYTYTPAEALAAIGAVTSWQVVAKRDAGTKNTADLGFTGANSTATSTTGFSVFGNIVLSMTAAPAEVVAGADTVTVKVALDNSAAGNLAVATLNFDVTYDATLLDAPTVKGVGRVTTTPTATPGTGKVTVNIVENIVAGTTDIVELAFKAKSGVTGDVSFAFAGVAVTSAEVTKAAQVKATATATATTKVMPAVTPGVIVSGAGTATTADDIPQLKDAIVALKISTASNLTLTADETTALTNYAKSEGPIGIDDAVEILDMLAK
jgi:hypothetical protein